MLEHFGEKRVIDTPIAESGFTRHRHRRGDGRAPAHRRVHDVELLGGGVRPDPQQRRQAPADVRRAAQRAHRLPRAQRLGASRSARSTRTRWSTSTRTIPGLKVVAPAIAADAKGLLKAAIRDDNPVLFMESETLYNVKGEVPDDPDLLVPIGKAPRRARRQGRHHRRLEPHGPRRARGRQDRSRAEGIEAEVVDLRSLRPLDEETIVASVRKTHRAVVAARGLALRRRRRRDRRPHPAPRLRRARRAGPPRDARSTSPCRTTRSSSST